MYKGNLISCNVAVLWLLILISATYIVDMVRMFLHNLVFLCVFWLAGDIHGWHLSRQSWKLFHYSHLDVVTVLQKALFVGILHIAYWLSVTLFCLMYKGNLISCNEAVLWLLILISATYIVDMVRMFLQNFVFLCVFWLAGDIHGWHLSRQSWKLFHYSHLDVVTVLQKALFVGCDYCIQ